MKKIILLLALLILAGCITRAEPLPIVPLLPDYCVMADGQQVKIVGWQIDRGFLLPDGEFLPNEVCR